MRSSLLFSPKEAGAGPTQTYLLSSSTWTPIEWNSLRLLFSVSESEIVSTWGQDWGSQWQGLDRGQDQGHKPALWETGEQKLRRQAHGPMLQRQSAGTRKETQEVRGVKLATPLHSPGEVMFPGQATRAWGWHCSCQPCR